MAERVQHTLYQVSTATALATMKKSFAVRHNSGPGRTEDVKRASVGAKTLREAYERNVQHIFSSILSTPLRQCGSAYNPKEIGPRMKLSLDVKVKKVLTKRESEGPEEAL
jgi:hypothetical protein